jgi:predicted dehydrogenase
MDDETIRIGFVGAGANTKLRHIPGFRAIEGVELVSVCNRTRESGQRVADEFQVPEVYDSWVDLMEAPDTDAICIGTWPYMHCTLVLAALENGKSVLTEARMAMNAGEAHTMLDASLDAPDVVAQIVPAPHTLKVDATIKEMIADGFLGEILSVDVTVQQGGFINYDAPLHWRENRDLSGYNIMHMGIWYEAMMRWVGPAASVSATTRVNVKTRRDEGGSSHFVTIPDHAEILCEMVSGPLVHMRVSAVTGLAATNGVWLFGTDGTLWLDASTMTLHGGRRGEDHLSEIEIPPEKQGGWRVEEEFINAIRGVEPVTHTSFEDGVRYMESTEAVTRSAESGARVYLPL